MCQSEADTSHTLVAQPGHRESTRVDRCAQRVGQILEGLGDHGLSRVRSRQISAENGGHAEAIGARGLVAGTSTRDAVEQRLGMAPDLGLGGQGREYGVRGAFRLTMTLGSGDVLQVERPVRLEEAG
jgi:hypothetical protein